MEHEERVALGAIAVIFVAAVGVGFIKAIPDIRESRRKRAQIKSWEKENLACIRNFEDRMKRMMAEPDINAAKFWQAWREEQEFLNIMLNRPIY